MAYSRRTPKTVKTTVSTQRNDATGAISCPKCKSPMVPMAGGKGFRCGVEGNRYTSKGWTICDGVIWNNERPTAKVEIPRAEHFPTIANPTEEQITERRLMSETPAQRGGRCVITDAGPGTAKTTTKAWGAAELYRRLGNMNQFPILTFNTNARDVMLGKLPQQVTDIATINSWHARAQGYRRNQYDTKKLSNIFKELVDHLPREERPKLGVIGKIVERMRDVCLFDSDAAAKDFWRDAVNTVLNRFASMSKKITPETAKLTDEHIGTLTVRAFNEFRKIDLQEQVSRPVTAAMAAIGWRMRPDCILKPASDWTDADVTHFAKLVRAIRLPACRGMVIDEGQDLSLCQIAIILAQVWQSGELYVIGDDQEGNPGEIGYKAGQAIYGWRGAFGGCLTLIARLWHELTGETAIRSSLTVTFRHGPEICDAYRPLNTVIRSALPAGYSQAWQVNDGQAFAAWLALPANQTALWITRTNAPLSGILLDTLKNHQECCIRGGNDFIGTVDGAIYNAAGWYDSNGEYKVTLSQAIAKFEENADSETEPDPNAVDNFLLDLAKAIQSDPTILTKAGLPAEATVGNLKRFISHFATKSARRVLTTVYRCKGDEADLAIVGDAGKFNESWGDFNEDQACRHVALSRAKKVLLTIGKISGSDMRKAPVEMFSGE